MAIDPAQLAGVTAPAADPGDASPNSATNDIGSDAFLQLLVTQLQNQDPLNPESNTEFISQLATFNSLAQLTDINKAVTSMNSFFTGAASGAAQNQTGQDQTAQNQTDNTSSSGKA